MRLTGGFLKGRKLSYKKTPELRPTRNIVREAIFDMLKDTIQGSKVLEIFAGTGALGFEALSRGALSVTFVDNSQQSIRILEKNCKLLNMEEKVSIMKMDVERAIKKLRGTENTFDIVFADPPYKMKGSKIAKIFSQLSYLLKEDGIIVVETAAETNCWESLKNLHFGLKKDKKYGSTRIQIYQKKGTAGSLSREF